MKCPTVKITSSNEQGYIIINKADYNEEIHDLFGDKKEPTKKEKLQSKALELGIEVEGLTVDQLKEAIEKIETQDEK